MNIRWKILLVEDDQASRRLIKSILTEYEVVSIDGHEAIQAVERESPDLILLDIHMPGANGIDICREVKNGSHYKIPIIFITIQAV